MKKADFIVIAVVAVVAGALVLFLYGFNNHSGTYVQVEIDGKVAKTFAIDEDTVYEIKTENGGSNMLTIQDGKAEMSDANCPDGICTNHRKIHRNGESIICLPHKVVVSVVDDNGTNEVDAVA